MRLALYVVLRHLPRSVSVEGSLSGVARGMSMSVEAPEYWSGQ